MVQSWPLFVYFRYFLDTISIIQIEKSIDGVLGIWTLGCRMVGTDETTELWWPPTPLLCFYSCLSVIPFSICYCNLQVGFALVLNVGMFSMKHWDPYPLFDSILFISERILILSQVFEPKVAPILTAFLIEAQTAIKPAQELLYNTTSWCWC